MLTKRKIQSSDTKALTKLVLYAIAEEGAKGNMLSSINRVENNGEHVVTLGFSTNKILVGGINNGY